MKQTSFYRSFYFTEHRFTKYKFTDNMQGIDTHFIGYMRKGHARLVSAQKETEIKEGDLFYIPIGCRYKSYWYGEPEIRFDSYSFVHFPAKDGTAFEHQTVPMTAEGYRHLEALAEDKQIGCASVSHLYALFSEMLPHLLPVKNGTHGALLEKAKRYIEENPKFIAKDLARHCGISESGLYLLFKNELGKSPVAFKNSVLAERAVLLLSTTDMPIEEIGQRLGFGSAAYFRKVIFSLYGKTPHTIRKEQRYGM